MGCHRLGSLVSLVRQGIALEVGFGTRSLEAFLWVAEAIEEGVVAADSLTVSNGTLAFELTNPPLRVGAFRSVRATVDGRAVPPERLRFRPGAGHAWRSAPSVSLEGPLEMVPGRSTEFAIDGAGVPAGTRTTVRLELESVAIPPLVWVEFSEDVRPGSDL
jgi:hypothetical protein